jgi:hypothetical protein
MSTSMCGVAGNRAHVLAVLDWLLGAGSVLVCPWRALNINDTLEMSS